jgi:hypothetical protein
LARGPPAGKQFHGRFGDRFVTTSQRGDAQRQVAVLGIAEVAAGRNEQGDLEQVVGARIDEGPQAGLSASQKPPNDGRRGSPLRYTTGIASSTPPPLQQPALTIFVREPDIETDLCVPLIHELAAKYHSTEKHEK